MKAIIIFVFFNLFVDLCLCSMRFSREEVIGMKKGINSFSSPNSTLLDTSARDWCMEPLNPSEDYLKQKNALMDFFYSTNGPNWFDIQGWGFVF